MRKNLLWMLLTTAFILNVAMVAVGMASPKPTISIVPKNNSIKPGETFTVNVNVADIADDRSLYGWEVEITFNSRILNVLNVTEGTFLNVAGYETIWPEPRIDNTEGSIGFGSTFMPPYPPTGASGNGTLATIAIEVKSGGATDLHFEYTLLETLVGEVPRPFDEWEYDVVHGRFSYGAAGGVSLELVAGVVIVVAVCSFAAFYYMRRRRAAARA